MNQIWTLLVLFCVSLTSVGAQPDHPLRVFIRAGPKTHGPGQHDGPRFLQEWKPLLAGRGMTVDGAIGFPTARQLENTDVLLMYSAEGGTIGPEDRANLDQFLKRGGGIVALHDSVCGTDPQWFKTIIGGAWEHGHSKWYEGLVGVYFTDTKHPISRGVSNFDFDDEVYYDLHMMPEARVLASSFQSVFIIAPQMWVYEKDNHRAFVWLQGHQFASFSLPHARALLMRGIAWAGKRANTDEFCRPEELASLEYPPGGPTAPKQAAQKINVHPEFNIKPVASEPLIEKAISLDWDPHGRLWVAETPEYPNGRRINKNDGVIYPYRQRDPQDYQAAKETRPAHDRIAWLEDTDGDGVMDKTHIFADDQHGVPGGLELVTSLVFYKDGVIVAQAPDILWIRDTDGDGVADTVQKLYTGFGTSDAHAVINNFRWGMDGWVYGAIGYSSGNPASPDGSKTFGHIGAGVFRFKPDGSAVEQVASGSCNTWGFDFNWDGEAFYTTATCGEHFLHIVMPEKVLARGNLGGVRASKYIADHGKVFPAVHHTRPAYQQIDWVGGFTAAAGCCLYTGGAWPDKFNGSGFVCEPTVNLVHNDLITPEGVSYLARKETGREETEFMAGTDLWFRPIHSRVGPDGALYVVDFYNQAVIHNDTRGPAHGANNAAVRPDRDHHFGRIWRVQHQDAKALPPYHLDPKNPAELVKMLQHPNGWVRMTAHRLLMENGGADVVPLLAGLLASNPSEAAAIHALWLEALLGKPDLTTLEAGIQDSARPAVQKNALKIVADLAADGKADSAAADAAREQIKSANPRVRLEALITLQSFPLDQKTVDAVVGLYGQLNDKFLETAALGIAASDPLRFLEAAFHAPDPVSVATFIAPLVRQLAAKQDATQAARLVDLLAKAPAVTDGLKETALENLVATLKADVRPEWSDDLRQAFKSLLASARPSLPGAVLPLIARWDQNGSLTGELKPIITQLSAKLADTSLPDEGRAQVAVNLLGVRQMSAEIIPDVAKLLGSDASLTLKQRIIDALGNTPDAAVGAALLAAFPTLPAELREPAFGQLLKRADWSLALVDALKQRKIDLLILGTAALHRLRTHPEKAVADQANAVIDEIRGPEIKEKNALIAQFIPAVTQPGDAANGHKLFTQNCSPCHRLKGEGRDLAPDLTGMGAHGPADLLVHVLDPNRFVEPNFITTSIETKDDLSYDGIIARQNRTTLLLRNATGDVEIRQDNIKSRRSTGLSLMPSGFEALGKDALRDLLAYLCADENRFRILDLTAAFTANSTRGLYSAEKSLDETIKFRKFGIVKVHDVPFEVFSPSKSPTGDNVIVLRGGQGVAKTMPQRVEIKKVGVRASKLFFLGGVGGWAWPWSGDKKLDGLPVVKVTVRYADNETEDIILKNGREFADYNGTFDVPGSEAVPDLVRGGQVRWFSKPLKHQAVIQEITLESFDNAVAPTLVAITAEVASAQNN
ncbi:MAG: PVC-type heme-binding CxxCH protein [Limisphaerales bacterium]